MWVLCHESNEWVLACKVTWHLNIFLIWMTYFFQHTTTINISLFQFPLGYWTLRHLVANSELRIGTGLSVRWRLWRKRAISLVYRQTTTWSNHSLSAHWYVLQKNVSVAEQPLCHLGKISRELFSSGGSQLLGSLPACCLTVLLEFIIFLYVWFIGCQQPDF